MHSLLQRLLSPPLLLCVSLLSRRLLSTVSPLDRGIAEWPIEYSVFQSVCILLNVHNLELVFEAANIDISCWIGLIKEVLRGINLLVKYLGVGSVLVAVDFQVISPTISPFFFRYRPISLPGHPALVPLGFAGLRLGNWGRVIRSIKGLYNSLVLSRINHSQSSYFGILNYSSITWSLLFIATASRILGFEKLFCWFFVASIYFFGGQFVASLWTSRIFINLIAIYFTLSSLLFIKWRSFRHFEIYHRYQTGDSDCSRSLLKLDSIIWESDINNLLSILLCLILLLFLNRLYHHFSLILRRLKSLTVLNKITKGRSGNFCLGSHLWTTLDYLPLLRNLVSLFIL